MKMLTVTIQKENAIGEKLQFEVPLLYSDKTTPDDVYAALLPIFRAMDRRQFELNLRVLEVNRQAGTLPPESFALLRDVLAGFNNILIEDPPAAVADA